MNRPLETVCSEHIRLLPPAEQLVMILNRIYHYGMTTTSGGNLSLLDSDGDIWITSSGIDKGSLTAADIIRVKPDGTMIGQYPHTISHLSIHEDLH